MNIAELSAPFPIDAIHWRAQHVKADKGKGTYSALALAYLDARDVMGRLDEVCGRSRWATYYDETARGRVLCKLSIQIEGEWITKTDGAGDTAVEGDKGGISDALKRAGVQWGIGRYLYKLGNVWAPCEPAMTKDNSGQWVVRRNKNGGASFKAWKPEARTVFERALRQIVPTGPINDTTRDWLGVQLQSAGKTPQDLLRHLSPSQLTDLTYAQIPAAQKFINSHKKEAA
jgi:hypothetical protein